MNRILVDVCSELDPHILKNRIPAAARVRLLVIVAPFREPSWGHVGNVFAKEGGSKDIPSIVCCFRIFLGVVRRRAPSRLDFGSFGIHISNIFTFWHEKWRWMGWWGYGERQQFPTNFPRDSKANLLRNTACPLDMTCDFVAVFVSFQQ